MSSLPSSVSNTPNASPQKQIRRDYHNSPAMGGPDVPEDEEQTGMTSASNDSTQTQQPTVCPKCQKDLESTTDSVVVAFAGKLYHVDCFRCAKCHSLVEHEANLLLLSDGSPVCEHCSYICSLCKLPITNEAIVTGDESYHAECFKCRSCSNKIEELVFAKTSAGLYCMSCHNERVSRSRKHMEARRNRSLKSSSRAAHSNNRSAKSIPNSSSPQPAQNPSFTPPLQDPSRSHSSDGILPSNARSRQESTTSTFSLDSASDAALANGRLTPTATSTSPTKSGLVMNNIRPGPHRSLSSPTSPTLEMFPRLDGAAIRNQPSRSPSPARSLSPQPSASHAFHSNAISNKGLPDRPRSPFGKRPATASDTHQNSVNDSNSLLPSRQYESLPHLDKLLAAQSASTARSSVETNKRASLMPGKVPSKAANRRSGFYGAPSIAPENQILSSNAIDMNVDTVTEEEEPSRRESPPDSPKTPTPFTPPRHRSGNGAASRQPPVVSVQEAPFNNGKLTEQSPSQLSDTEARARVLSFYDPDMLGFLDNIPPTPDVPKTPRLDESPYLDGSSATFSPNLHAPDLHAVPSNGSQIDDDISSSDQEYTAPLAPPEPEEHLEDTPSPVARELRESIRQSRDAKSDMMLDVTLVETLIAELEQTKERMKKLQSEYTAMKRTSHQVIQGISEFRDEYEREAELRRDAQAEMGVLKATLFKQAQELASLESVKREQSEFQARQIELRSSVYGMEKELSTLKAKRDIAMAEVEELEHHRDASEASSTERFSHSLEGRLEEMKREYAKELEKLVAEKEEASRQIQEIARERDSVTQEVRLLEARAADLERQNAEALGQLQRTRDALAQAHSQKPAFPSLRANQRPLASSHASNSSVGSNGYDTIPEAGLIQAQRIEGSVAAPVRKFKWGKGNKQPSDAKATPQMQRVLQQQQHSAGSSAGGQPNRGVTSTDSIRQHIFQPTSILRPVKCEHCGDKMWGLQELRCSACFVYCHARCAPHHHIHCNSAVSEDITPIGVVFGNDLSRQAAAENVTVPHVVTACIAAVEEHGMDFEGIYRKTGGMSQVKQITQGFELSTTFAVDDGNCDISAVTSVLKNYFRALENPLFTFQLHDDFVAAAESPNSDRRKVEALEKLIQRLPEAHIATLGALMLHLHRVHLQSDENKMTPANLGVVFSPTLLRSHIAGREFSDINHRAKVVELCIEHAPQIFGTQAKRKNSE